MATKAGDDPESLMSLCTVFCLKNLRRTMCYTGERNKLCLRPDVFLPSEICDKLVNVYMELVHTDSEFEPQDGFFQLFCDPHSTRLSRLHLREDAVRDRDLEAIGKQDLMELHLTCCNHLSSRSLRTLRNFRHTLVSLSLFGCSNIFFRKSSAEDEDDDEDEDEEFCDGTDFSFQGFRRLCVLNVGSLPGDVDPEALLKPLGTLRALDLSSTHLPRPAFLAQWREQLASLVLYNVDLNEELIATVLHMSRLRHLDISREGQRSSKFKLTRKILTNIVQSLGNLVSLDISGHVMLDNCTVPYIEEAMGPPSIEPCKSSIYPFQGLKRPLQFLGLYNTTLCNITHIPAFKVTGSKNEEQVLNAIEAYTEHRPELAHRAINQLFDFVRIQHCNNLVRAVQVQRNCCLTLCNFNIPDELEFQYHRVNLLLLKILEPARQDESIQRIAVHLCNALVCQVDNDHKEAVGKMGFVKTMLNLIQKKLHDKQCDQVMEFSWSALWNITDETPDNCQMFLNCSGMNLFLDCLKEFPDKQELHRNMLGLLGNVAEVKELRPQLLTSQFVTVFSNLLGSKADGIEVSYNACGVLSHIMFDGPEVWTVENPNREMVMDKMWDAIQSWDVTSRRNINYRSFEPILRLLPQSISPVSQHWATWALYNLVSVYPSKYCPLLVKEGGIALLKKVLELESSHQETKTMARKVMEQCENFKEDPMDTSRGPNLLQHDNAPVHKVSSMKTWCVKVGVEELECPAQSPDLNPTEHLWDELEHRLHPRPPRHPNISV
ncbi:hypothetical protein PDJAM_G00068570 [Pangasius djambal]|uniref:Uncharacterized protein n=1 Tax=Pangasius djambal TaxID=1691987 RepID=A0ACC5Z0R8_9TELE|nr:hypothetical protein [Pangasius djambal]